MAANIQQTSNKVDYLERVVNEQSQKLKDLAKLLLEQMTLITELNATIRYLQATAGGRRPECSGFVCLAGTALVTISALFTYAVTMHLNQSKEK